MQLPANRKLDKYIGYCLIAILLPVTRLLGILLRRDHRLQQPPQHLLFIKLPGLGSLVVASGSVQAMRQKYPNARFIILTDSKIAEGIEPFKVFDDIWRVDTGSLSITISTALKYIAQSWRLKELWVADLEVYSKLTTVFALLTMARNRFGFYLRPVFFRKYFNTHNILFKQSVCLEDNYDRLAQAITNEEVLPIVQQPVARENEWQRPYIIVNNTCSSLASVRKLPDATFAAICNWILTNTHYRVAFVGTANDKPDIDQFVEEHLQAHKQKGRLLNIAGALDVEACYRFIADKGACMVTIDCDSLHIARKLGLPTVSIWEPTDPMRYIGIPDEQQKRHLAIYTCIKEIPAESIIEKIDTILQHVHEQVPIDSYEGLGIRRNV